ncbi:type II toxin-antitoxin system YafQ family toxin [Moheibacter sediminis]|uniref:type II toxin-antitoxin system YafQ family toxin n=1 Tax=Moheibacter sediminis TaxID=1434700 RepID=UPI0021D08A79|nr:type II toxin-antitoxin system YafQ family toxin [Moheibacter sediminis]
MKRGGVSAIPPEMNPHKLKGNYKSMLECQIQPDLLIIWLQIDEPTQEIRLGSHSELF